MNKKKVNYLKISLIIYLILEILLYVIFIVLDFSRIYSSNFKYASICFNFLFSLIVLIFYFKKERLFLTLGFFFTLFSDFLLLYKSSTNEYILGIAFFIIVQSMYFIRFIFLKENMNYKRIILEIAIRLFAILITMLFIYFFLSQFFNLLNLVAISYFVLLVGNFIDSLFLIKINRKNIILSIGLFLFILCDVMVGLTNIAYNDIFAILMWVFYLPSQVLIFISSFIRLK